MGEPTNKQTLIAPIGMTPEHAIRESSRLQGCVCGDALIVRIEPTDGAKAKATGIRGRRHTDVEVIHLDHCPLLARAMGQN